MESEKSNYGQMMEDRYDTLRKACPTIERFEKKIKKENERVRQIEQSIAVSIAAIRQQERWLRKEATAQIQQETGIRTLPGFSQERETPQEMRKRIAGIVDAAESQQP